MYSPGIRSTIGGSVHPFENKDPLGKALADSVEQGAANAVQGVANWYQNASAHQEGIGDDLLRLMAGGVRNTTNAWKAATAEQEGITDDILRGVGWTAGKGMQVLDAGSYYLGKGGGNIARMVGVDPRIGGLVGNVLGDVVVGGAVAKVGKIGAIKGAHKLVKTDLPGRGLAAKGLQRHYVGKAADARKLQLRAIKREVGGQSQAIRRGELNLQAMAKSTKPSYAARGLSLGREVIEQRFSPQWLANPQNQEKLLSNFKVTDFSASSAFRHYFKEGRAPKNWREQNLLATWMPESNLDRYYRQYGLNADMLSEAHHILQYQTFGPAAASRIYDANYFGRRIKKANLRLATDERNIAQLWSTKAVRGVESYDHKFVHKLYDQIPEQQQLSRLMSEVVSSPDGPISAWQALPKEQAGDLLVKIGKKQDKIVNEFLKWKIQQMHNDPVLRSLTTKTGRPVRFVGDLSPEQLGKLILEDPAKFASISQDILKAAANNPEELAKFYKRFLSKTGRSTKYTRKAFGIKTGETKATRKQLEKLRIKYPGSN